MLTFNEIEELVKYTKVTEKRIRMFHNNQCFMCLQFTNILYKYQISGTTIWRFIPYCESCKKKYSVHFKEKYIELNAQELFVIKMLC